MSPLTRQQQFCICLPFFGFCLFHLYSIVDVSIINVTSSLEKARNSEGKCHTVWFLRLLLFHSSSHLLGTFLMRPIRYRSFSRVQFALCTLTGGTSNWQNSAQMHGCFAFEREEASNEFNANLSTLWNYGLFMCWCFVRVDIDVVASIVGDFNSLCRIFHTIIDDDIFCIAFANGMNKSMAEKRRERERRECREKREREYQNRKRAQKSTTYTEKKN